MAISTRIVLINLAAWKLFQAGTAPVRYLFFFVALDNSLAVGTFLVWTFTEKDVTLVLFFKEIAGLVFRFPSGPWSSFAVLVTGIVQFPGGVLKKRRTLEKRVKLGSFSRLLRHLSEFSLQLNYSSRSTLYLQRSSCKQVVQC